MRLDVDDLVVLSPRDINTFGQGVAEVDGMVIFCDGLLPGDRATCRIISCKKSYARAVIETLHTLSSYRREPFCSLFGSCGGCSLQHMDYAAQLQWKGDHVIDQLVHIGHFDKLTVRSITRPTIGMEDPFYYRNKSQFAVAGPAGHPQLGFYRRGSHTVCDGEVCKIGSPAADVARATLRRHMKRYRIPGYDEVGHRGLVRHLLVRTADDHRSVMVCPVLNGENLPEMDRWVNDLEQALAATGCALDSVFINVHKKRGNTILGSDFRHVSGSPYIEEAIRGIIYRISPASFFQINTTQTAVLYKEVIKFADLSPTETALDLYCGTGSIGLQLADQAKRVFGNEVVASAVADARINAEINGINNASFSIGLAEEVIPTLYEEGLRGDCVVVDPPRKGCDKKLLDTILTMLPERLIYVSCNPATLARDLRILADGGFKLQAVQSVDLFPWTTHVECVTLMSKVEK